MKIFYDECTGTEKKFLNKSDLNESSLPHNILENIFDAALNQALNYSDKGMYHIYEENFYELDNVVHIRDSYFKDRVSIFKAQNGTITNGKWNPPKGYYSREKLCSEAQRKFGTSKYVAGKILDWLGTEYKLYQPKRPFSRCSNNVSKAYPLREYLRQVEIFIEHSKPTGKRNNRLFHPRSEIIFDKSTIHI